jgi:hypothetical protein
MPRTRSKAQEDISTMAENLIDIQEVTKANVNKKIKDLENDIIAAQNKPVFSSIEDETRNADVIDMKQALKVLKRAKGMMKKKD